jgi:hypothetical protein
MTLAMLAKIAANLSSSERYQLWLTCPAPHPTDRLVGMTAPGKFRALRYCPRCFTAFTADGRPVNAPLRANAPG